MLVNNLSSSTLKRVYEQKAQHNSSVQQICCPPTTIREHRSEQPIDNVLMHSVYSVTNGDGIASLSHLTIHSCKGKRDGSGWGPTLSSVRRHHSARWSSPLAFVHGSIGTIVAVKACPLVSCTRQCRRRTILFTWWMDVHVLKAFACVCYHRGHWQHYYYYGVVHCRWDSKERHKNKFPVFAL